MFNAADGYIGIAIIYGAMAFFWFIGIHGPSIVEPAINAIAYLNLDLNLELFQAGEQATNAITPGLQHFVGTLGGTGATFVVPFMFMWLGQAKKNKAVGRASFIPTAFGVNEPILFGAPLVLNPIFFIPFVLAPIVNVWLFKFFVDVLGMNSFMYFLPWTTPGPIGLVLGTGFDTLAFVLAALLLVVDVAIYYPFFKVYDNQVYEEEQQSGTSEEDEDDIEEKDLTEVETLDEEDEVNVLVLCAGGGTSALLRNSLNNAAEEYDVPMTALAGSYGEHYDTMQNVDVVVLAPQVSSNYEDIKKDTDRLGVKLITTEGEQYVNMTNDPEKSMSFILDELEDNN